MKHSSEKDAPKAVVLCLNIQFSCIVKGQKNYRNTTVSS